MRGRGDRAAKEPHQPHGERPSERRRRWEKAGFSGPGDEPGGKHHPVKGQ